MDNEQKKLTHLTQEEIDDLKEQLLQSVYADIGKSIVKKILWVLAAIAVIGFAFLAGKGHVPL